MKKMNITENLLRNMTTRKEEKVAMFDGADTIYQVEKDTPPCRTSIGYLTTFKVEWSCSAAIRGGVGDAEFAAIKLNMVRHLKNDMYRDILNELHAIHKMAAMQPYHNKELNYSIQALIEELG